MLGLSAALKNPFLSATRLYQRLNWEGEKVHIMTADWDTLVILDGCRYDMFERLNTLPGTLESRLSPGSATDEFIRANFGTDAYHDVVYITANPRVNISLNGSFHSIVNVWDSGWDDELQTVPPETITDATLQAQKEYPDKRIISHFVQPHAPFIGDFAQNNLEHHSTLSDHRPETTETTSENDNIWTLLRQGEVDQATVKRAYAENLELTFLYVKQIMDAELGKIVVTSDHGNLLGDRIPPFMRRFYGHPRGFHADELIRVPWLEYDNGHRRDIVAEAPETDDKIQLNEDVKKKLEDLGYV